MVDLSYFYVILKHIENIIGFLKLLFKLHEDEIDYSTLISLY
jgi:hypothetical protein